jgi:hypothetical protein
MRGTLTHPHGKVIRPAREGHALAAFDAFETWGVKYDKAVECLIKDRDALLAFYDFPAEHWKHLRTTNVIESSFATVQPGGGDCYLVEPYERTNRRPGLWLSR